MFELIFARRADVRLILDLLEDGGARDETISHVCVDRMDCLHQLTIFELLPVLLLYPLAVRHGVHMGVTVACLSEECSLLVMPGCPVGVTVADNLP